MDQHKYVYMITQIIGNPMWLDTIHNIDHLAFETYDLAAEILEKNKYTYSPERDLWLFTPKESEQSIIDFTIGYRICRLILVTK